MHDSYFQNASNDAIATRKHHANTARTHDQCTAMLHCHDYCANDVDSLRSSHKRAITGKVLDPNLPRHIDGPRRSRDGSTISPLLREIEPITSHQPQS
jgi:hypothetical protein